MPNDDVVYGPPLPDHWVHLGGDVAVASAFLIEVDGVQIGIFREVSGLEVEVKAAEIREGGQNGFVRKLPTRMEWTNITLKRGVTVSNALFEWMNKSSGEGFAANGNKVEKLSGAITAISFSGARLRSWDLKDVFPVKWTGPSFAVKDKSPGEPLEETLVIAHHGFTVDTK